MQTKHIGQTRHRHASLLFPLGTCTSRRAWGGSAGGGFKPPPSVAEALLEITVNYSYESQLSLVQFGEGDEPRELVAAAIATQERVQSVKPGARIPVSGALHECKQLRYNRPGPECASGCECAGASLPGSPGPLKVYQTPAEAKAEVFPPAPAFCLLCIRHDAAALAKTLTAVVSASEAGLYKAAMVLPPFQNKVGVVDGYKPEVLGVTPAHSFVFTPIAIAGPNTDLLSVEYDEELHGGFYVDQQALMACCPDPSLNCLAFNSRQGPGLNASSQH